MGYHMSKKGSKRARRLLYLVAMNIVNHDQSMKELYERLLKGGRKKKDALCIIMHKLVKIIYAMLKHKRKYQSGLNIAHSVEHGHVHTHAQTEKNRAKRDKIRRFQDHDKIAPISRRQLKKRQKQNAGGDGDAENVDSKKGNMNSGKKKNPSGSRK
jgi:hypothetical protein